MTPTQPEVKQLIPAQRIDYLFKLLNHYYPQILSPFWLSFFGIRFHWLNDLAVEMQMPEQLLSSKPSKFSVDQIEGGEAIFGNIETVLKAVAFIEYMHYNQADYIERLDLVHKLVKYKYKCEEAIPLVVYTGQEKCRLKQAIRDKFSLFRCLILDLTQIKPQITMDHPLFPIQFMTIFNQRLSQRQLANFFIRAFKALRHTVDDQEFYRFGLFIQLATMPHNAMAVKEINRRLFEDKPESFYHELLKDTPIYQDLMRFQNQAKAIYDVKTRIANVKARIAEEKAQAEAKARALAEEKAQAEAKARTEAEEKAQAEAKAQEAARIAAAVQFIQDYGLTVADVANTLKLTEAEIAAVESALKA
jgi:hypothetical protein